MNLNKIQFKNEGWVNCKGRFYSAMDILQPSVYTFEKGVHIKKGEIDSGNWAVSYYLSMYGHRPKDFVLAEKSEILVNDIVCDMKNFSGYSCYMDRRIYPYFSKKTPLNKLIYGNQKTNPGTSVKEVKELFQLTDARFNRSLTQMGNEGILGMAAVGYSMGKEVFCFPWMSAKRFDDNYGYLSFCFDMLEKLGKIVIVPVGL